jgi:Cellulase (glycosyl hydrolase family 5)
MTNVIWDAHVYGYMNNGATDAASNNLLVAETIAACQAVKSADGVVPVIIGEFGTASNTNGNGPELVTAVLESGIGYGAWVWDPNGAVGGPSGDPTGLTYNGLLSGGVLTTDFGVPVAADILAKSKS